MDDSKMATMRAVSVTGQSQGEGDVAGLKELLKEKTNSLIDPYDENEVCPLYFILSVNEVLMSKLQVPLKFWIHVTYITCQII